MSTTDHGDDPKLAGSLGSPPLSYSERCIIQHTLGLDRGDVIYRNYFSAEEGHEDLQVLNALAERELMVRETSAISPGFIFRVTRAGKQALIKSTGAPDGR